MTRPLRITCYGSSSSSTPDPYLKEAYELGVTLGKRGHTCVNGAGMTGCMGHLNRGAADENGHIVGVMHKMFVLDGEDWGSSINSFKNKPNIKILMAKGYDLQHRKQLLIRNADGVIVLPGGPGTWDELCEMICQKNLGISSLPIAVVNINGYYDSFKKMMERCYDENLMKNKPEIIVKFVKTASEAVTWVESQVCLASEQKQNIILAEDVKKRTQKNLTMGLLTRSKEIMIDSFPMISMFSFGLLLGLRIAISIKR